MYPLITNKRHESVFLYFFDQHNGPVLRSSPRDSPTGGSRDGRRPPPYPVSARADDRLSRGPASTCAYVCVRVCARGEEGAGWEFSAPLLRCYVTGPGFPLFPSRSAVVRSCTVGFRSF